MSEPRAVYDVPTRPALRYYGGKWRIAPWIISHMPAHRAYLEPCMGAASVFAQKCPVDVETLNDANGRVTNFFLQLRDNTDELVRRVSLTPWAEDEFKACWEPTADPVEDARRFYVTSWQSVHGVGSSRSGWRWMTDPDHRRGLSPAVDWIAVDATNTASLSGSAFSGASGNIGVNVSSGTGNLQANSLALAVAQPSTGTPGGGGGNEP